MIINTDNAPHYQWGNKCDGWHLLQSETLSVIQERMPAGTMEILHYHQRAQQLFFMLSGRATLEIEGQTYELQTQDSIAIGPGKRHQIRNESREDLHFLVISQPPSHGDRVNCVSL